MPKTAVKVEHISCEKFWMKNISGFFLSRRFSMRKFSHWYLIVSGDLLTSKEKIPKIITNKNTIYKGLFCLHIEE